MISIPILIENIYFYLTKWIFQVKFFIKNLIEFA